MSLDIRFLFTMFAIFPAIVGIYKYKRVDKLFHPFIFMMWLEVGIEILNYTSTKFLLSKNLHYIGLNSYMFINFYLFLSLAYNFKFLDKNKKYILLILGLIIGVINLILIHPFGLLFYLLFFVSFVMLAISIDIISKQMMAIKQPLVNNFWFWMSGTSVIYNAQTLLVFSIYSLALLNIPNSKKLGNIETFVNAGCYVLFWITMLKMPERNNFNNRIN